MDPREDEKRAAAQEAAMLVPRGATVGLGSGTTVAHFLAALARRNLDLLLIHPAPVETEQVGHTGTAELR